MGLDEKQHKWQRQGSFGADYSLRYLSISEGDTYITLRYDRFGETVEVEIPLPEGGAS